MRKIWNMNVGTVPIMVGADEIVRKHWNRDWTSLDELEIGNSFEAV